MHFIIGAIRNSAICGLSVLLPLVAQADPHRFEGDYRFSGKIEARGRLSVDLVDTRMSDAAQRLQELRSNGAQCRQQTATAIRCSKMHSATSVDQESVRKAAQIYSGFFVSFGMETSSPSLISEADSLTEWKISQRGQWNDGRFESYRYLRMRNSQEEMAKLIFTGAQANLELFTRDGVTLGKFVTVQVNESRWKWHQDVVTVVLEK